MKKAEISCAKKMKVLADETRLTIMRSLMKGPLCVSELNEGLHIEQSLLSHHLRILRDARLVTTTRAGKSVRYGLNPDVTSEQSPQAIDLGCCTLSFD